MLMKKWEFFTFGGDTVVIDNRIDRKRMQTEKIYLSYGSTDSPPKLYWKPDQEHKERWWTPLAVLPVSERFNLDEQKVYAQMICDVLNANEILPGSRE